MAEGFRNPRYLVETEWLAANLGAPDLRVFDCTVYLHPDPPRIYRVESGRADYDKGHIPNSGFLDLVKELSRADSKLNFMMPEAADLAERLARRGIGEGTRVVLYARANIQWATRVWWMLRAIGFDQAMVLNGGYDKWLAESRPVTTEVPSYPPARLEAKPRPELFCDKTTVRAAIGDGATCILNALRPELHNGSSPVHYGRPGRIPGSVNVPGIQLTDPVRKTYKPAAELKAMFAAVGAFAAPRVLAYCGGGIAATNDAFVLTLLGYDKVSVYDASMSEWANDPAMPMEKGACLDV
jgi:thiosulfate/3-mercaptopyruvate sulfurtransferase